MFEVSLLQQTAARVGQELDSLLTCDGDAAVVTLNDAMRYSALDGGKRVRPFLVMTCFASCGGRDDRAALRYAAAVEMIHCYSLIHDDLPAMDNDEYRRGRLTNHKVYGEAMAILAGDGLLTAAFAAAAENPFCGDSQNLKAVRLLAEKAGVRGMLGGQAIDILSEGKAIDAETLTHLQDQKTACLLECACMLGAVASGAPAEMLRTAETYGKALGRAFQIRDDILDLEGDEAKMGKHLRKDDAEQKATYPAVHGTEAAKAECIRQTEVAVAAARAFPETLAGKTLAELAEYLGRRES